MPVYKDEKRNTWYSAFYYKDWQGNRKKKKKEGFKLKREAQDYEREFIKQQSGSCEMTFKSMAELYLADCKTRQRQTSYYIKENCINTLIIPYFDDTPINTITVANVRNWQTQLLNNPKNYSPNYLHTVNGFLSSIFNHAVKFYGLPSNPSKECGKIKEKRPKLNFWTLEEFQRFMEVVDCPDQVKTMYNVLFWTGARVGELLALTLNDFDFEKCTLSINKTYARHKKTDLIQDPKTEKSNRTISIPLFLKEDVKAHISKLYDYSPDERLFDMHKDAIGYYIDKYSPIAGVHRIRVHDLRHSHASLLINLGEPPLLIQERLGHENIETTLNTYSHLYPNQQAKLADKLQQTFNNSTFSVR